MLRGVPVGMSLRGCWTTTCPGYTAFMSTRPQVVKDEVDRKLAAIRAAARYDFPTADIDQMLREIDGVPGVRRLGV